MFRKNQILGVIGLVVALFIANRMFIVDISVRFRETIQPKPGNVIYDEPSYDEPYGDVIGIELGDTHSRVGIITNREHYTIIDDMGYNSTPSYVAYTKRGFIVGRQAVAQASMNPKGTFRNIRSILGRKFSDSKLQKTIDALPYEVVNIGGEPQIRAAIPGVSQLLNPKYKYLAPEEITAKIIAKLKLVAERYYGYAVTHAVITVPSYFNDDQRQATKDACILAGLTCLRVLNEPIAAAMGHQLDRVDKEATHIVYNIGDEGIDVTLLDVDGGIFEILRSVHNSTLSSEGFDKMVLESVIQQSIDNKLIQSKTDIENIGTFEAEVKKAQDILMIDRSDVPDNAVIRLKTGGVRTSLNLTKAQVLSVQETLLKDSMRLFDRVLKMAKVTKSEVGHVVPVGKMSILKQAQPILKAYFEGKDKMLFSPEFDPDDAIVRGAASQGAILGGESGATGCTLMMDVNPLSLGIELTGGAYGKVVPRNTVIPTRKFVNITTVRHDQEKIVLNIYQGEEFYVMFNNLLGRLEIDVPKKPLGESVVELLFEIDVNYNLKVLARVLSSGKETRVDIPAGGNSRMSWLEMDKIITRAETHREYEKGLGESYAVAVIQLRRYRESRNSSA